MISQVRTQLLDPLWPSGVLQSTITESWTAFTRNSVEFEPSLAVIWPLPPPPELTRRQL